MATSLSEVDTNVDHKDHDQKAFPIVPKPGTEIAENDVGDKMDSDFTAKADTGETDTKVVVKTVISDMEKDENQTFSTTGEKADETDKNIDVGEKDNKEFSSAKVKIDKDIVSKDDDENIFAIKTQTEPVDTSEVTDEVTKSASSADVSIEATIVEESPTTPEDAGFGSVDGMTPLEGHPVGGEDNTAFVGDELSRISDDVGTPESSTDGRPMLRRCTVTSFHKDANTYIQTRDEDQYFFVHHELVSAISPALAEKMQERVLQVTCGDRHQRGYRQVVKMVDENDDPVGLSILFQLIHWKFHELSDRLSVDHLFAVARVVDKYDCIFMISPYAERWLINGLHWHIAMNKSANEYDKILVLAWIFGEGRAFAKALPNVVSSCTLDSEGVLVDYNGKPWKNQPIPTELIDIIKDARYMRARKMVATFNEPCRVLLDGSEKLKYCRSGDATAEIKEQCLHLQLGSLMSGLNAVGMMPFPMEDKYLGSFGEMVKKLETVKVARYKLPGTLPHTDSHINCGFKHREAIKAVKQEPVYLTRSLFATLRRHGEESMAFRKESFAEVKVKHSSRKDDIPECVTQMPEDSTLFIEKWVEEVEVEEE